MPLNKAGAAVVNTGQVAVDVTSNVLQQAGSSVYHTGQVCVDITANTISNVINSFSPTSPKT